MVVTTTGYIVSVLGPYLADSKNNPQPYHTEESRGMERHGCLMLDDFIICRGSIITVYAVVL